MISRKNRFILSTLAILACLSCNKVIDDFQNAKVDLTAEFGLHLADMTLYMEDSLLADIENIETNDPSSSLELYPGEDGVLKMHFRKSLETVSLDRMLNENLEDTLMADTIDFPMLRGFFIEGNINFGFQLQTFSKQDLKGKTIDTLRLDKGKLRLDFNTYDQFYSEFNITFPGITNDYNTALTIENFSPTTDKNTVELDLNNHKIKVLQKNSKEYFIISLNFYIESQDEEPMDTPFIKVTMSDLDIDYAYGAFGQDTIKDFGKQIIEMPDLRVAGQEVTFDFDKPQIQLQTINGFSVPLRYVINDVYMQFADSSIEAITGFPDYIDIDAPDVGPGQEYTPSSVTLDPSTNFDLLLGRGPENLIIDGMMLTNPENPEAKNYIHSSDSLSSMLDIVAPFEMYVTQIELKDTSETEIFKGLDNSTFDTEILKIKTDVSNGFPLDLDLQVYFYNEFDMPIDSLFDSPVKIKGPNEILKTVHETFYVDKDQSKIEKLYNTKKAVTVARFKTSDAEEQKIVSFRDDQKLDLKLTLFSRINIDTGNED